jgi:hypothetical protein
MRKPDEKTPLINRLLEKPKLINSPLTKFFYTNKNITAGNKDIGVAISTFLTEEDSLNLLETGKVIRGHVDLRYRRQYAHRVFQNFESLYDCQSEMLACIHGPQDIEEEKNLCTGLLFCSTVHICAGPWLTAGALFLVCYPLAFCIGALKDGCSVVCDNAQPTLERPSRARELFDQKAPQQQKMS